MPSPAIWPPCWFTRKVCTYTCIQYLLLLFDAASLSNRYSSHRDPASEQDRREGGAILPGGKECEGLDLFYRDTDCDTAVLITTLDHCGGLAGEEESGSGCAQERRRAHSPEHILSPLMKKLFNSTSKSVTYSNINTYIHAQKRTYVNLSGRLNGGDSMFIETRGRGVYLLCP